MARKVTPIAVSKAPNPECSACNGFGTVHMTAHFASGDQGFDWPCWECFGQEVRLALPAPPPHTTDNS